MSNKEPNRQKQSKDEIELNAFRSFTNNSPDFALLSRIEDLQFVAANDLACKGYGYTRKQFLSLGALDIVVTKRKQKEIKAFYDTTPVGKVKSFRAINKRNDGSHFPVDIRFSKINEKYALAHIKDLSDEVNALESKTLLAQITRDASVALVALDLKLNIIHWNQGCENLLGYTTEEVLNNSSRSPLPTIDMSKIKRFITDPVRERELLSMNSVRIHKSGKRVEVNATYWVTRDEKGVVNGLAGLMRDISKEKLTQRIQDAVVNIAQASSSRIVDTKWFSNLVYNELGKIMDVENFYIILYDRSSKTYSFPIVEGCSGLKEALMSDPPQNRLLNQVLCAGEPLFEQKSELLKYIKARKIKMETKVPEVYLGVPLKSEGEVIGVLAVQSFKDPFAYSLKNMIAFELVSNLISNIMTRDLIINELMSSEEHYRSLSEKSASAITVLDKSWEIKYESAAAKQVFGKNPNKMLGHNFLDNIHPEDQRAIEMCLTMVSRTKNKNAIEECRYRHGNGSWVWAELSIKNLLEDPVVKGVLIHKKDVTQKHETEERLKSSEAKFKSVVTRSLEAIYFADPVTRKVIDANQSFLDYTGYSKKDFGRISLNDFVVTANTNIEGYIQKVLAGENVENIERIWKPKSGEEITVLVSGDKIEIDGKQVIVFSARDISPQKRTEKELLKINHELDTFVYKASHDLRGPLTTCLGLVNMSKEDVKDQMAVWYFDMIKEILDKLDGILQDLTQITSIRQGHVIFTQVDLAKLVAESLENFAKFQDIDQITLKTDIKLKHKISSDAPILRMVLRNMIGNAIKYRKKTSNGAFLKITASQNRKHTILKFQDNGIGVDASVEANIFQMFFRGTTESQGSGLGLYMVRTGLNKIGSEISVKSKPGEGATFTITLPKATS
ncbi:MAG: PAS domain S-box protein [Flavobacteriales bacterium]|nr:PAS domain S-box protein [Flavobacteriales bacterium]